MKEHRTWPTEPAQPNRHDRLWQQADLVIVVGDSSRSIADVRNLETVFKQGVGYDPAKLIDAVKERVGLW